MEYRLCSRLDIQEIGKEPLTFTEDVNFHIYRVYPKVQTPFGRECTYLESFLAM